VPRLNEFEIAFGNALMPRHDEASGDPKPNQLRGTAFLSRRTTVTCGVKYFSYRGIYFTANPRFVPRSLRRRSRGAGLLAQGG